MCSCSSWKQYIIYLIAPPSVDEPALQGNANVKHAQLKLLTEIQQIHANMNTLEEVVAFVTIEGHYKKNSSSFSLSYTDVLMYARIVTFSM